jgi:hypothetical protein
MSLFLIIRSCLKIVPLSFSSLKHNYSKSVRRSLYLVRFSSVIIAWAESQEAT